MWSSHFFESSPLKAVGIDRLGLMDVRSLARSLSPTPSLPSSLSLSLSRAEPKRRLTAAQSKHSGFIITSSLVAAAVAAPAQTGSRAFQKTAHMLQEEKVVRIQILDAISFLMLFHSGLGLDVAL